MRYYRWIKKEFFHLLPIYLFFLVTFSVINLTEGLMLKRYGIDPFSFLEVLFAALVAAKVFFVLDHLPFINIFSHKPIIYSAVWKTTLCCIASIFILLFERGYNYYSHADDPTLSDFITQLDWPKFCAI